MARRALLSLHAACALLFGVTACGGDTSSSAGSGGTATGGSAGTGGGATGGTFGTGGTAGTGGTTSSGGSAGDGGLPAPDSGECNFGPKTCSLCSDGNWHCFGAVHTPCPPGALPGMSCESFDGSTTCIWCATDGRAISIDCIQGMWSGAGWLGSCVP